MENAWKTNEKMDNYSSEPRNLKNLFSCNTFVSTNPRPTSVHALRPNDIEIIGAIGDSLTVHSLIYHFIVLNFNYQK